MAYQDHGLELSLHYRKTLDSAVDKTEMRKLLTLAVILASALGAQAKNHKISSDTDTSSVGAIDVIVQFQHVPGADHAAKIAAHGGTVKTDLTLVKALHVSVPASELEELANDPEVAHIWPDRPLKSFSAEAVSTGVNASYVWSLGYTGASVGVALVDSGIGNVDDLKNSSGAFRVAYAKDFVGGGTDDQWGHGTHVAGEIGGTGKRSSAPYCKECVVTFKGIAPDVEFINLRALNNQGRGTDSSVINAINAAIQLKAKYNIRVLNLSLGRPVYESYKLDPLCQAVERAWDAGIVVVVAAGNDGRFAETDGYGTITAPGNDPYVITVGAMKQMGAGRAADLIASYSSKGPTAIDHIVKPDVVAPGNRVYSLVAPAGSLYKTDSANRVPLKEYQNTSNSGLSNDYFMLSGTSMATGVVSGVAADLLQANPSLTPDQIKAILMRSASKIFPEFSTTIDQGVTYVSRYDVFTVGAGYVDAQAAISMAFNPPPASASMISPTAAYDTASGEVYFVSGQSSLWGSSALWGTSALWGANAFVGSQSGLWGSSALWGASALWGTSSDTGFGALWSSSALWGAETNSTESLRVATNGEK